MTPGYGWSSLIEVIGIAIHIVSCIGIAAAGDYELPLLSRTIASPTQHARVEREIGAAAREWLHVINIEVLRRIPMDKAALFTNVMRLAVAKFISPGCEHPVLPIPVQDLLTLGLSKRNTRCCHDGLLRRGFYH